MGQMEMEMDMERKQKQKKKKKNIKCSFPLINNQRNDY